MSANRDKAVSFGRDGRDVCRLVFFVNEPLHISNQFVLPYGWGGEAIGFYSGEMIEGQTKVKPLWTVSLGVRKNLLKDKFSLYIYA